jgi:hypothetical protein
MLLLYPNSHARRVEIIAVFKEELYKYMLAFLISIYSICRYLTELNS